MTLIKAITEFHRSLNGLGIQTNKMSVILPAEEFERFVALLEEELRFVTLTDSQRQSAAHLKLCGIAFQKGARGVRYVETQVATQQWTSEAIRRAITNAARRRSTSG